MSGRRPNTRSRAHSQEEAASAQVKPPDNKIHCSFCGAPCQAANGQDVAGEHLCLDVKSHVSYFQAASKKSAERSKEMATKLNDVRNDLRTQQEEIDALNKGIQSEKLQLNEDHAALKTRENELENEHESCLCDLRRREKDLLERELSLEEQIKNLHMKETAIMKLEKSINSRSVSLMEKEASLAMDIKRREEQLNARENQTNDILNSDGSKDTYTAKLHHTLETKEATFKELKLSTLKELNGREAALERRESAAAKKNSELENQRTEIDMLRQEIQKREEKFEQWKLASKDGISACQQSLTEKEEQLSIQMEKTELRVTDLSKQMADFIQRESDFKEYEVNHLQEMERREKDVEQATNLILQREEALSAKEKVVRFQSEDIILREESFEADVSIWRSEMDRREKLVVEKEESIVQMVESNSEKQEALVAAEKEIENRRTIMLSQERDFEMKIKSENERNNELNHELKKKEESLTAQEEKLDAWEIDLRKREGHILEKHAQADCELQSRERDTLKLEERWATTEREYAFKLEDMSKREFELAKREDAFLTKESSETQGLSRRLHDVEQREEAVKKLEQIVYCRQAVVVEGEDELSAKSCKLDEFERKLMSGSERREAELSARELNVRNLELSLREKEEDIEAQHEDLLARVDAHKKKIEAESKLFTSQKSMLRASEVAAAEKLKQIMEREDIIARDLPELKERLKQIEAREVKLSSLMVREKQFHEHEQMVEIKEREINNRSEQLQQLEASMKKQGAASNARIKELDKREVKLHDEEKLLRQKIDRHALYASAYEDEKKQTRSEICQKEKNMSVIQEDVGNREKSLAFESSELEEKTRIADKLDARLQKLLVFLNDRESKIKEFERELVNLKERYKHNQETVAMKLEQREKTVTASENLISQRQFEIEKAEQKICEDTQILVQNRTRIQSIRQEVLSKDNRIHELEKQIRQIEVDLQNYYSMNSKAIDFLWHRKASESIICLKPQETGRDGSYMKLLKHSHTRSFEKNKISNKLSRPANLNPIEHAKPQLPPKRKDIVDRDGGQGWYEHVRNIIFGLKNSTGQGSRPGGEGDRFEPGLSSVAEPRKKIEQSLEFGERVLDPETTPLRKKMRIESLDDAFSTVATDSSSDKWNTSSAGQSRAAELSMGWKNYEESPEEEDRRNWNDWSKNLMKS